MEEYRERGVVLVYGISCYGMPSVRKNLTITSTSSSERIDPFHIVVLIGRSE
jgi:hypothetical protein